MDILELPIGLVGILKSVTIFFVQSWCQTLPVCAKEDCSQNHAGKNLLGGICPQNSLQHGNDNIYS